MNGFVIRTLKPWGLTVSGLTQGESGTTRRWRRTAAPSTLEIWSSRDTDAMATRSFFFKHNLYLVSLESASGY